MPRRKISPTDGQSTLEYAVFIAIVSAALIGMNDYVRRSIQANLKSVEERINAEALGPAANQPGPNPDPGPGPGPAPDPGPNPGPGPEPGPGPILN